MYITLIDKAEHTFLLETFKNFPNLTLQNKGYETLYKDKLTSEDLDKIKEVEALLKKSHWWIC